MKIMFKVNLTIISFIKKELKQALRDVRMRIVIFAVPAVQMALFGLALTNEVRNIKIALVSKPNDVLAIKVVDGCYASGWFRKSKKKLFKNKENTDPVGMIKSGMAEVVLVAPPEGFTNSVLNGKGRIQVLIDATDSIRALQVEMYVKTIMNKVVMENMKYAKIPPTLIFDVRVLYNPSLKSSIFMVPAVMCMVLSVTTIILTAMALAKEKEIGTFEMLITAPVKNWEILAGKTLPYILLAVIDIPIIISVAVLLFNVPMKGHFWQMFFAAFVFISTTVSIGILISTFAKTQQQAMMSGFMFIFPAIFLSGMMFPIENIPDAIRWTTYLNPLRYFVTLLRNIMLKGGNAGVFWTNISAMIAIAVITISFAIAKFKQKLN